MADEDDVAIGVEVGDTDVSELLAADAGGVEGSDDEMVSLVVLGGFEEIMDVFGGWDDGEGEAFSFGLDFVA